MDIIYIHALNIQTHIGIFNWEQAIRQTVVLDLDMRTHAAQAAKTDRIENTIDYACVSQRLTEFISSHSFQLIETLAEQAAQLILKEFNVTWLRLNVSKPGAVPHAKEVGVCIERGTT